MRDESVERRLAFVEQVIAEARERWRGVLDEAALEEHLETTRQLLMVHPVAMEYVSRAMPRTPPLHTEEEGSSESSEHGKAVDGQQD